MIDHVEYDAIVRAEVDTAGNLRLYRRGFWWATRQVVFHPAGEWASVQFDRRGVCVVSFT